MNRRRFLAASAAASALPLSGCAARETTLNEPETPEEDAETHLVYRDGDDEVATVSYMERQRVSSPPPYGLWVHVGHSEATTVESLRVELDAAPAQRPGAAVYLQTPEGHPYPEMHYHTDAETGAAVVAIDDTGSQGGGSMSLEFLVAPLGEESLTVVGETSVRLRGRRFVGRVYEFSDRAEFDLSS
jgi:hypothetical protein